MRIARVRPGEAVCHVAARTLAGSSYAAASALPAYLQAIVALNSQQRPQPSPFVAVVDWTALPAGLLLALPD